MSRIFVAKVISANPTFTDWVDFLTAITAGSEGYTASLLGLSDAIIVQGRKNKNGKIELISRLDFRLCDSTQLTDMLTALGTASAHTPQTPHVSTGGTVLANNGTIGLNNLEFIGAKRNLRAGFVIDTYNSSVSNKMFGVGVRDKSLADSTSLEMGGMYRSAGGTNSSVYARDSLDAPSSTSLTTVTGTLSNGVIVEAVNICIRAGDHVTPDNRGSYILGCNHSAQTAGGFNVTANSTSLQTDNSSNDEQITFTNTWDLTNVIRLIWLEAFGMEAVQV